MSDGKVEETVEGGSRGRILVVDDSRLVRAMVGGFLRSGGFEVDEASDGRVALDRSCIQGYDVIVTDIRMPQMDGFALLEEVKRLDLGPEVVILTGTHAGDISCAVRALRLGAHDFLTKPPSGADEVVLTVTRAVEKKRLRETNARLVRELQALSRTDALTGVSNRRAFDETLRREVKRAERYGLPLSLVLVDVDHFKRVNDHHGHPVGDEVLKGIARVIADDLRQTDAVYRYGGEEFAVLLPHTPFEGALEVAGRLVAAVAARPMRAGHLSLKVTISAGVSSAEGADLAQADLVAQADVALYAAKRAGRNRARGQAVVSDAPLPVAVPAAC